MFRLQIVSMSKVICPLQIVLQTIDRMEFCQIKKIQYMKTQTTSTIWTNSYCILIYRPQYFNVFITTVNNHILNICLVLLLVTPFPSDLTGIMHDPNEGRTFLVVSVFSDDFFVLTTSVLIKYFECHLYFVLHKIKLQFS